MDRRFRLAKVGMGPENEFDCKIKTSRREALLIEVGMGPVRRLFCKARW